MKPTDFYTVNTVVRVVCEILATAFPLLYVVRTEFSSAGSVDVVFSGENLDSSVVNYAQMQQSLATAMRSLFQDSPAIGVNVLRTAEAEFFVRPRTGVETFVCACPGSECICCSGPIAAIRTIHRIRIFHDPTPYNN